jgi:small subunit ribosomal protein S20
LPAEKSNRVQQRRRVVNRTARSSGRTLVKKAERVIAEGEDVKVASAAVVQAVSALDRAARKGVVHPNNAARRKSRLVVKLNRLAAEQKPVARRRRSRAARVTPKSA